MKKLFISVYLFAFVSVSLAQLTTVGGVDFLPCQSCTYGYSENTVFIDPNNLNRIVIACNTRVNTPSPSPQSSPMGPDGNYHVSICKSTDGGITWDCRGEVDHSFADPSVIIDNNGDYNLFCMKGQVI